MVQSVADTVDLNLLRAQQQYPEKFAATDAIFRSVRPGARIFVGTGCAEPQFLVRSLVEYVESHPKAIFDAELIHVVGLGVAPYADSRFKANFRCNAFFIGGNLRSGVNLGLADYSPVFLSEVPGLISNGQIPIDIALIQTSLPDAHGFMSLGVSVDIVKAAVQHARLVIAQCNHNMPRVHGDGFIPLGKVDYVVCHDEPIMEYENRIDGDVVRRVGDHVSKLVRDGDVIQVGYGRLPNAILPHLRGKRHLGVHTEMLSDGLVQLMQDGVVDNSEKTLNRGKTVASFCMGKRNTYDYIHDNSSVELKTIDYTNNPLIIAAHHNMTAINSALEIDLTGQATAESIGTMFYSGIGGQADFMRGAVLAPGGKTILAIPSTAKNSDVSRIVPLLRAGTGVTLNRGDVHYVVTEFGTAYLHGKSIRDRAMSLISIAHPKFQQWLVDEAKRHFLVHDDQTVNVGIHGEYPSELEMVRTTVKGLSVAVRPVKVSDEPLLKDFFYGLSERSMALRFVSSRRDMPHERLQKFTIIDYARELEVLATLANGPREEVVGIGWWYIDQGTETAEVAFAVKDDYQNRGIGTELLSYLMSLGKLRGFKTLLAEVLIDNGAMIHVFRKSGFRVVASDAGMQTMRLDLEADHTKAITHDPI